MATNYIIGSDTLPSQFQVGDILKCGYSGTAQTITLPKGKYQLECWGAQGGSYPAYSRIAVGGKGGYSKGILSLTQNTTLYLYVGGVGSQSTSNSSPAGGGWNGGGNALAGWSYSTGGGGATHIAKIAGLLNELSSSQSDILIVAGGGGGAATSTSSTIEGGYGGGSSGGTGTSLNNSSYLPGTGGTVSRGGYSYYGNSPATSTQSSGAGFGQGANAVNSQVTAGGGGGWYGGGSAYMAGAGGGSGYINETYLTETSLKDGSGSENFPSTSSGNETGHEGDGYIRITVLQDKTPVTLPTGKLVTYRGSAYGTAPNYTDILDGFDSTLMNIAAYPSGSISQTNANTYEVSISLKDTSLYEWSDNTSGTKRVQWTISQLEVALPVGGNREYTGNSWNYIVTGFDSNLMNNPTGQTTGISVGPYTINFTLKDTANRKWANNSNGDVIWNITKKSLTIPSFGTSIYNTQEQFASNILNNFDSATMNINSSSDISAYDVGNYTAIIELRNTSNYKWSDGSITSKDVDWSITEQPLTKPTLVPSSFDYDGSQKTQLLNNFDSTTMTKSGDQATNAGTYNIIISLKDNSNYKWEDGTKSNLVLPWSINKATIENLPYLKKDSYTFEWNVRPSPTVMNFDSQKMDTSGDTEEYEPGNYTLTVSLTDSNYIWNNNQTSISLNWVINKRETDSPSFKDNLIFVYNGNEQTCLNNYNSLTNNAYVNNAKETEVGNYTCVVSLKYPNYFKWEGLSGNNESADITCQWSIIKASLSKPGGGNRVFNNSSQNYIINNLDSEKTEVVLTKGDLTGTQVDNYTVYVQIKNTYFNNYKWENENDEIQEIPITWYIVRAISQIKDTDGNWRFITGVKVKINDNWISVSGCKVKQSGHWKDILI